MSSGDATTNERQGRHFVITPEVLRSLELGGLVSFRAEKHGGFKTYNRVQYRAHWVFLWYVFLLEWVFHGFVLLVVVKVIVFMLILHDLIPDQGDPRLSVYPFLYDPERRYGLDQLFRCYNQIAVLIALGASFLILISMNTIEVQSAQQPFRFMSMLNMLGFIAVVIALLILVAGPFLFASSALRRRQAGEISDYTNNCGPRETLRTWRKRIKRKNWANFVNDVGSFLGAVCFALWMTVACEPTQAAEIVITRGGTYTFNVGQPQTSPADEA